MRTIFRIAISWSCGFAAISEPGAKSPTELQQQFHQALAESAAPGAFWGIQVTSQRSGATWFATNAAARLIPASNVKLYTAALTLDRLGADYRFVTSLRTSARPNAQGELKGDLLVVGSGDPTLSSRFQGGTWEKVFSPLVQAVRAAGIRRIAGNLVCDESRFRGPPYGSGWAWDDLAQGYGAAVSALSAEDNVVRIIAQPGSRIGTPAALKLEPISPGFELRSEVTTGPTDSATVLNVGRLPGTSDLEVTGTIPLASPAAVEEASVSIPALWFGRLFREALRRAGIEIGGDVHRVTATDRAQAPLDESKWSELVAIPSTPAGDIVRGMMKPSQNLYAQLLLLGVGAEVEMYPRESEAADPPTPSTEASGLREMDRFLRRVGIPKDDVLLEEGSGLSRKNLITPRATVQLLEFMSRHRWAAQWEAALPVGGVDGTLRNRFGQPPTRGNVRAKTGSLQNISSLSGYVTNAIGEPVIFSILVNNYQSTQPKASVRREVDHLVELIAASEIR